MTDRRFAERRLSRGGCCSSVVECRDRAGEGGTMTEGEWVDSLPATGVSGLETCSIGRLRVLVASEATALVGGCSTSRGAVWDGLGNVDLLICSVPSWSTSTPTSSTMDNGRPGVLSMVSTVPSSVTVSIDRARSSRLVMF